MIKALFGEKTLDISSQKIFSKKSINQKMRLKAIKNDLLLVRRT
jgi:hypothetical protein